MRESAGTMQNDAWSPPKFESSWSLGEAAYQALRDQLERLHPTTLVEFGSGVSTLRLAHDFPGARITTLEGDPTFFRETAERVAASPHAGAIDLRLCPPRWQRFGPTFYLSFEATALPSQVDAVLIDGPPLSTRRGREACLYQVFSSLRVGGLVFLDDHVRGAEQRTVRNWLARYRGAIELRQVLPVGHQLAVLEKTADAPPRAAVGALLDNWYACARLGLSSARQRLRGARP